MVAYIYAYTGSLNYAFVWFIHLLYMYTSEFACIRMDNSPKRDVLFGFGEDPILKN